MRKLWKSLSAWLLVFSLLLGMMPVGFAAGDEEITLTNGDFESGNTTGWNLTGFNEVKSDGTANTTKLLNLWLSNSESQEGSAAYTTSELDAGTYYFKFDISGADGTSADSGLKYAVSNESNTLVAASDTLKTTGWDKWETVTTDSFTLESNASVTFTLSGTVPAGYWGYLDNLKLYKTDSSNENPPAEGYAVTVTASKTSATVGDKVTFTAKVFNNGEAVTELGSYDLWFYPDSWKEGHTDGVSGDGSYAVEDSSGKVLSTDITLNQAGTYYMAAQLKNGDGELAIGFVTVTVTASGTVTPEPDPDAPEPVEAPIYVPYVKGSESEDFIRGVDVSSVLSILNSGAHYYDADGNMLGAEGDVDSQGKAFMQLLADSGVNWVRLRIWPDPYDADGNGYGGGNNDLNATKIMGKWATDAGMKVLIDFHYSDFWTDPGKQMLPKNWPEDIDERAAKVKSYTTETLTALIDAGVNVRMVQVGNETNQGICGVMYNKNGWSNAAKIFNAGCEAVHSVTPLNGQQGEKILAAVHFANPESGFTSIAKNLNDNNVDYDVFASSYYPFWHGTTDNLKNQLSDIATKYGKQVMVAETSWAWTLKDGDGHDNTVRVGSNDTNPAYVFSVQGQALEVATVMQTIAEAKNGIGVFYWEPAWIPVQNVSELTGKAREEAIKQNKVLWDQYGSGWAATYSADYDPEDAGRWAGGSAVDNQAVFDFDGKALESLNVFKYVMTGTTGYDIEYVAAALTQEYQQGETLALPDEVEVTPSLGDKVTLSGIEWDSDEAAAVDTNTPGYYIVNGTVSGLIAGESVTVDVQCTVTVRRRNYLTENPDFEDGDTKYTHNFPGKGITTQEPSNVRSGKYCLHYWKAEAFEAFAEHDAVTLEPGTYTFGVHVQGNQGTNVQTYVKDTAGNMIGTDDAASKDITKGQQFWATPVSSFTLTEPTAVIVGLTISGAADAWGSTDDWYIEKQEDADIECKHESIQHTERVEPTLTAAGNIEYWYCPDCEKHFSDVACTNEITEAQTVIPALTACTHTALQHEERVEPTVSAAGNIEYWYCPDCEKYFSDAACENEITQEETILPALTECMHENLQHIGRVEPTVSAAGNIEYWYCPDCEKYFSDAACTKEITREDTVLPALSVIRVTGVSLRPSALVLEKDETGRLTAIVEPANAANKRLIWTTSDPSVAEVKSNGAVTAVSPGRTVITVTTEDGGFTDTCEVTVLRELSVTAEAEDAHLNAAVNGSKIRVSGTVSLADGEKTDLTLVFLLPDGSEKEVQTELSYTNDRLSVAPETVTVGGKDYTLDIIDLICLNPNVAIDEERPDTSVSGSLENTLTSEEKAEVEAAASSVSIVNNGMSSIISAASEKLHQAGMDALDKVPEGTSVQVLVYMKVEATGYTAPSAAAIPSLKLDITPVYKVINKDTNDVIEDEQELNPGTLQTAVEIQVTLPEGFVRSTVEHAAVKHYDGSNRIKEWLDVVLAEQGGSFIASFLANSFSEYEVTKSPTVTAIYHALDGEHTAIYHYARIGKTSIPKTEQMADRFLGWSVDPDASAATYQAGVLTQEMIDRMYAVLDKNGELHLYPVFQAEGGKPVIPDTPNYGSGGATHTKRDTTKTKDEPAAKALTVNKETGNNGTFSISPRSPEKGDRVTITATPDAGYLVDTVTVTNKNGRSIPVEEQGNNRYTFTMPSVDVTVEVSFRSDGTASTAAVPASFIDVSSSDWFQQAVNYVSANGIMLGNGNRFSPNDRLSRGMMAQILYSMENGSGSSGQTFPDVTVNDWFAPAVSWASSQGYMTGYGNGSFGPNDPITREQIAAILYRCVDSPAVSRNLSHFADADEISDFAENALCWAVEHGIINGKSGGILDPKGYATRAETASILMYFQKNMQ